MSSPTAEQVATLRADYLQAGQDHVFEFWSTLTSEQQTELYHQLLSLNPVRVNSIYLTAIAASAAESLTPSSGDLAPPPVEAVDSVIKNAVKCQEWNAIGLEAIKNGEVGILLMAGGQGTRLGSSAPKGCYDINLPSNKSLFQLQAERIKKLESLSGTKKAIPWYIMTSGPTREPSQKFFAENDYFGLHKQDIIFFEQGVLPCLSNDGEFLLDSKFHVAVAPDGNGGIYSGLRAALSSTNSSSVLSDAAKRGIKYFHTYGVDNCLVKVADPVFLGYNISKQSDCGAKVVKKTDPEEAVGVVALRSGKWSVVEYSEIPKAVSESREKGGGLQYRAANIVNHFYTLDFLNLVSTFESKMAFHIAHKKIPHIDITSGQLIKPTKPNGMKLELFVFDVFPFTQRMSILEVARSTDFSPLKNAPNTGSDDPQTSRRDLLAEHKRWLIEAGAEVADGIEIELSPLVSYAGEGLASAKGKKFVRGGVVHQIGGLEMLA